jgi:hypothetical protein
MKKILVFIWIIVTIVFMSLYAEYVISREIDPILQLVITLAIVANLAGVLKYTISLIINFIKDLL